MSNPVTPGSDTGSAFSHDVPGVVFTPFNGKTSSRTKAKSPTEPRECDFRLCSPILGTTTSPGASLPEINLKKTNNASKLRRDAILLRPGGWAAAKRSNIKADKLLWVKVAAKANVIVCRSHLLEPDRIRKPYCEAHLHPAPVGKPSSPQEPTARDRRKQAQTLRRNAERAKQFESIDDHNRWRAFLEDHPVYADPQLAPAATMAVHAEASQLKQDNIDLQAQLRQRQMYYDELAVKTALVLGVYSLRSSTTKPSTISYALTGPIV